MPRRHHPEPPLRPSSQVTLRFGYEVDIREEDGLEHLFNAVIGTTLEAMREAEHEPRDGWLDVYRECELELHYVAGQLLERGSSIDLMMLLDEFSCQWDRIAEKLSGDDDDDADEADDVEPGKG